MNGPVTGPQMWTARRLWTVAIFAALAQVGLIYWASDRTPFHARTASATPGVRLAALSRSELLTLTDPTLFTRAHGNGFSGPAWLALHRPEFRAPETTAAPQWLTLAPAQLGAAFRAYLRTNPATTVTLAWRPAPALTPPGTMAVLTLVAASTVQVEGALAARELIRIPAPPAQTNADILLPSEVQLLVDARGNSISAVLLRSSGSKPADQLAVTLARDAQFAPDRAALARSANDPEAGVVAGQMIFRWRTEAVSLPTNGGAPQPALTMPIYTLILGFLVITLGAIGVLTVYSELRRRRFEPHSSQDRIFRCRHCSSVYTDDPDVDRSRCPQCGKLNEPIVF